VTRLRENGKPLVPRKKPLEFLKNLSKNGDRLMWQTDNLFHANSAKHGFGLFANNGAFRLRRAKVFSPYRPLIAPATCCRLKQSLADFLHTTTGSP